MVRGGLMLAAGLFIFLQPALVSSVAIKTVLFIVAPFVILSGILEIIGSFKRANEGDGKKGRFSSGLATTVFGILLIMAPLFFGELTERLVRAADRGVRVRVLVDDINLSGRDARIAALDAHPNIEIRVFNPFKHRKFRALDFATDFVRVNHRMHNKIMVMDNALSLVGGRNIGAHYFQSHAESNFRDLDIVGAGPIVRETSTVFDRFWSGPWSIPISDLVDRPFTQGDHRSAVEAIRREMKDDHYPLPIETDVQSLLGRLEEIFSDLIWGRGEFVWEDPASIHDGIASGRMNEALYERMRSLKQELLIESAYFVPRDRGIEAANKLRERGVKVRVLTNSLTRRGLRPSEMYCGC